MTKSPDKDTEAVRFGCGLVFGLLVSTASIDLFLASSEESYLVHA